MNRKSKIDGGGGDDDVESLLRAAEDEVLLNLSVNSHMARGVSQSSYIDPDLDRRFQALKSTNTKAASQPPLPPKATTDDRKAKDEKSVYVSSNIGEDADDLFARFAALKTSVPSSSSSSSLNKPNCSDEKSDGRTTAGDEVDEDEVQKLIQWAIDAARLDPSPPTDTDDDEDNVESSNDDDDDSDDYSHDLQKKGQRKKGKKRN